MPHYDARSFTYTTGISGKFIGYIPYAQASEHPAGGRRPEGRNLEAYNVFMLSDIGRSYTSSLCRGGDEGSGGDWDVCWGCSSALLLTLISSSRSTG